MNKDIPEEVLFDIAMDSYDKFNSTIASMYDHTEIYSHKEIEEMKKPKEIMKNNVKKII